LATLPSHREIQQCLVDIGDKEAKFLGSRQWIGSMEVGFVLETKCGIQSRVISVSSGADMASKVGWRILFLAVAAFFRS
jgi:hypothetical protein